MKIIITSQGKDLNSEVDPRFGRCRFFIILDTETNDFEVIENPNIHAGGGAGTQAAQTVAEKGAEVVLTGNVGPNAFMTLTAADIMVYTGVSGRISDAVDQFKKGALTSQSAPTVESHHGMQAASEQTSNAVDKRRLAVASETDQGLESNVSAHFGRCPYYTIADIEDGKLALSFKVENPF